MTKTRVKVDLSKLTKKLSEIQKGFNNRALLEPVSKIAISDMQREARSTRGFDKEGNREKLPSISDEWVERRKKLSKVNTTTGVYSPKRSNLSFTGQLLDSLKAKFSGSKITISPTGTRTPYKNLKGGQSRSVENKIVAEGLQKRGFRFLGVDKKTKKKIKAEMIRFIRRLIRS